MNPAIWTSVDISAFYNIIGITVDGTIYGPTENTGLDGPTPGGGGNTLSASLVGTSMISGQNLQFSFVNAPATVDCISCLGQTISFTSGVPYTNVYIAALATNGNKPGLQFTVNYTDGGSDIIIQDFSDWATPQNYLNEEILNSMSYRNLPDGTHEFGAFRLYAYNFAIRRDKTISSISLPNEPDLFIFSMSQGISLSGLYLWAKADDVVSVGDGQPVTSWPNLSNAFGSSGALSAIVTPTLSIAGINGKPSVHFDGIASAMAATVAADIGFWSVFAVIKAADTGTFRVAMSWGPGGLGTYWSGYITNAHPTNLHLVVGSDSENDIYADSANDTNVHVVEDIHSNGSAIGYDSGVIQTNTTHGNDLSANRVNNAENFVLGGYAASGNIPWLGEIGEIIVCTKLNDDDRVAVENYLFARYNMNTDVGRGGALGAGDGINNCNFVQIGSGGAKGDGPLGHGYFLTTEDDKELSTENGFLITIEGGPQVPADNSFVVHNVVGSGGGLGAGDGVVTFNGSTTYTETGSGGAKGAGTGITICTYQDTGSGGAKGAGTGPTGLVYPDTGSGGAEGAGNGLLTAIYRYLGGGGARGNGTGIDTISGDHTYVEVGSGGAKGAGTGTVVFIQTNNNMISEECINRRQKMYFCRHAYIPNITRCTQNIIKPEADRICSQNN